MHNRRYFLQSAGLTALGLYSVPHALLGDEENDFYNLPIRNNVGIFVGSGGTIGWLMSSDGTVVVDTGTIDTARRFLEQDYFRRDKKIDIVINTHHHRVHTDGNVAFKGRIERLLAHENSSRNQRRDYNAASWWDRFFEWPEQYYPDTILTDEWHSSVGKERISAKYFGRAHTDGDIVVHFENANVAHLGDIFYKLRPGFFDIRNGATVVGSITVLEKIRNFYGSDTLFICGHAPRGRSRVCDADEVKLFQDFLSRLLETVDTAIRRGYTRHEIVNIAEIPGFEDWTGSTLPNALAAAYRDLKNA